MENEKDKPDIVELEQINIITQIPKDTIKMEIIAYIMDKKNKVIKVKNESSIGEIFEMRQDFLDNLGGDDYNDRYVLTEKGKEFLAELEKKR